MGGAGSVRVGVIGCGAIARLAHLPVLGRVPGARIIALADPDSAARRVAAHAAPSATLYGDFRDLLARPDVDAVVIALPTALHAAVATDAIERGKHIYLEKPLASTLDEARAITAAAERAPAPQVRALGFNYRFNPLLARARAHIVAGAIGRVIAMQTVFSTPPRGVVAWKRTRASGGGALLDLGSHHIDLARWLLDDDVVTVSADIRSQQHEDDCATLRLSLATGTIVQSFFSLASVEEDRISIFGERGRIVIDRYGSLDVVVDAPLQRARRTARIMRLLRAPLALRYALAKRRSVAHEPSYRRALAHFIEAAGGARFAGASFMDGERVAAVIDAAERSARTATVVSLADATTPRYAPAVSAARVLIAGETLTS